MGWKEVWEKYQIAATFAEAGEEKMARHFLEEGSTEEPSPEKADDRIQDQGKGILRPSHAEG